VQRKKIVRVSKIRSLGWIRKRTKASKRIRKTKDKNKNI